MRSPIFQRSLALFRSFGRATPSVFCCVPDASSSWFYYCGRETRQPSTSPSNSRASAFVSGGKIIVWRGHLSSLLHSCAELILLTCHVLSNTARPNMATFARWLANMLNEDEPDVDCILTDETALHFLIAWTLFESKCFGGFLSAKDLPPFATRIANQSFDPCLLSDALSHFHQRYQDRSTLKNLLHEDKTPRYLVQQFEMCLQTPLDSLQRVDQIFLVAFVVYRYRNNMFHGNKGVTSWLQFRPQIRLCTDAMKAFVSHAESLSPSMAIPLAA